LLTRPTGAQLWQIISDTREGVLATINDDGSPQLSNVYYVADPSTNSLRLSTTTVRRKGRNLQRDPRATLHVTGKDFLNFAVVEGDTTLFTPKEPNDSAIEELFEVHTALGVAPEWSGFGEEMIAAGRMVVRLSVKRIYGQLVNR
jgi:PPOX class probable F420-dependent enzyme